LSPSNELEAKQEVTKEKYLEALTELKSLHSLGCYNVGEAGLVAEFFSDTTLGDFHNCDSSMRRHITIVEKGCEEMRKGIR
jgi:hypothetical protein